MHYVETWSLTLESLLEDLRYILRKDETTVIVAIGCGVICLGMLAARLILCVCGRGSGVNALHIHERDTDRILYQLGFWAARASDGPMHLLKCKELVIKYPHLINNSTGDHGYTPFLRGCWNGVTELVALMLEKGADISSTTTAGESPLYLASYRAAKNKTWDPSCIQLLLEAGCDINACNVEGNTPLHWAAKTGNKTLAVYLLLQGADREIMNCRGYTPYLVAMKRAGRSTRHWDTANVLSVSVDSVRGGSAPL